MENSSYDSYLKALGNNIRRIRKDKGLTMETVASEMEIEYRQLGRIERGEINTSVISLLKLSKALQVELYTFFQFDNKVKR